MEKKNFNCNTVGKMDFKKWDEQYHQEKKEWINLVKDFINTANGDDNKRESDS